MPPKCVKCTGNVNKNHKSIKCEFCEASYHHTCTFLSDVMYTAMCQSNTTTWMCDPCKVEFKNVHKENGRLIDENELLKNDNENLKTRLNVVEEQVKNMKNVIKNEILQELKLPSEHVSPALMHDEILSCMREEKEREKRKLNLCIKNFPEEASSNSSLEVSSLSAFLSSKLTLSESDIKSSISGVKRVGEIRDFARLLIVSFDEPSMRRKILQNSPKLKNYRTATDKKIFIIPDMTPKQQEENKKLNEELWSRRQAGERVSIRRGKIVILNPIPSSHDISNNE